MREPMDSALAIAASLLRAKLKFVALVGVFLLGCVWYAEGFTATSAVITVVTIVVFALFVALVWFWTTVFANAGNRPGAN
jgi:hypothetical protein